ncbi:DEKNAAC104591 [Brettanomyces naardenensis]|uniref:DEKNAAC104591 n=1 Tax=Brettanomyces naardenensis TaxID=13370 RepID=A0A448YRR1_BRENA|nr:DEKNAAC104591 [Brettanomyces naardenensis]
MSSPSSYPKPLRRSFNSWQINSAREMHQLTVKSRLPHRLQPQVPNSQQAPEGAIHTVETPHSTTTEIQVPAKGHNGKCNNPQCVHCGAVIIPSPAASFPFNDTPSISINDWQIYTSRNPILSASEIEEFESILQVPVPEMIFGNNKVEVMNTTNGFHLIFNPLDALKTVSVDPKDMLKVSYANEWYKSRERKHRDDEDVVLEVFKPYDWTYTTHYKGTELVVPDPGFIRNDNYAIPQEKLTKKDPILFFDEMTLFEDELGDNGISTLSIKIRVMRNCMLILQRLFVRVDDVMLRIRDTRLYVDFEDGLVIREFKRQEQDYGELLKSNYLHHDPRKMLRDIQWCASKLPVIDIQREYLQL